MGRAGWDRDGGSLPIHLSPQITGVFFPSQRRPPHYRIENMRVPVAMWSGEQDWISPRDELVVLWHRIPNIIYREHFPEWNHFDPHWGLNAPQLVYSQMVAMMEENP